MSAESVGDESAVNDPTIHADETPTTETRQLGPHFTPTHSVALPPVTTPPHSVDGFVQELLRELNGGQGLALGGPWEFPHPEAAVQVDFGGHTETYDDKGTPRTRWVPDWNVLGIPYNHLVPGYQNGRVNTLRLWSAQATKAFDLEIFNAGDYAEAVRAQT